MHGTRIPHRAGFTLIELVAIVGIIFLLAGMLLPARAKTRRVDLSTICLRNAKEFAIAWNLYSANNHQVCNNFTIPDTLSSIATKRFDNWANNLMTWTITGTDGSSNTNIALAKSGVLSKYASDDIAMYKCPSDQFLSAAQRRAGWKARLRSISMNALFGRWDSTASSGFARKSKFPRAGPEKIWRCISDPSTTATRRFSME